MPFKLPWIHKTPEEEAARAEAKRRSEELALRIARNREAEINRQSRDLQALQAGGIPVSARERLSEIGATDADSSFFTSNLDPDEAALLRLNGYRMRGIVAGSAMYHVGQAYASTQHDCEVNELSAAYDTATSLAVSRMRQELQLIGAHGVVGVRLTLVRHEWADGTIEVQVIGTAVEGPGVAPEDPWMCDLSVTEWWALHRAGYDSAGLVWGHCTWFILTSQMDEWATQSWTNQEITHWSAALSRARSIAMRSLTKRATQHHANGVAGVRIAKRLDEVHITGLGEDPAYEREHHNLVISIIGTAIRARPGAPTAVKPTVTVLSLRDGRMTPVTTLTADATIL